MQSQYVGSELELFAEAKVWKAYWSRKLLPYIGTRLLDVGAGLGATARLFASHPFQDYLALEPDPGLAGQISAATGSGELPVGIRVVAGTTADLSPGPSFDTILYIDVLEHISDDRAEVERASALLAPGGCLIVLAPAHQYLFSPFDTAVGHVRRYNRKSLRAAIPPDLHVERVFYLDSVGLLASLANRLALRASSPSAGQIRFWDRCLVRASLLVDRLFVFSAGKTIIGVFRKASDPNPALLGGVAGQFN